MKFKEDRQVVTLDLECYRNYFLAKFREAKTGRLVETAMLDGSGELNRPLISKILRNYRVVTFNGINYDIPLLALAMTGVGEADLKKASDRIIVGRMFPWQFEDHYGVGAPGYLDHIDLINVAPGVATLKMYGGRLHAKTLQDLPVHHMAKLTPDQAVIISKYCGNDLGLTQQLYDALSVELEIRNVMSEQFGIDLRSKSDAQIAESVIKQQVEKITGKKPTKPVIDPGYTFNYKPPRYIKFKTEVMQKKLNRLLESTFAIDSKGKVRVPIELKRPVVIGDGVYRMGIGGLHSSEKRVSRYSDDDCVLIDVDADSYYPRLMILCGLFPSSIGYIFTAILDDHVTARLAAKEAGKKKEAHSRKIIVNSVFGKTGSPHSIFYAPDMMIAVTVTGQLALLMMIEELERRGITVVSANTDGVTSLVHKSQMNDFREVVFDWEWSTGFTTSENRYISQHSRDVNNYFAIEDTYDKDTKQWLGKPSGFKSKGAYADEGLQKNPVNEICLVAIKAYLRNGTDIVATIKGCDDIRKFTTLRSVSKGAEKDGFEIGKTVRWYYSTDCPGPITNAETGAKVPRSNGARPCLDLPDEIPDDLDYNWYIRETFWQLSLLGIDAGTPVLDGVVYEHGFVRVKAPTTKSLHWLDKSDRTTLCGYKPKDIHDLWHEFGTMPDGYRMCPKCRKAWDEDLNQSDDTDTL